MGLSPFRDKFQSTRPVWGATLRDGLVRVVHFISIHAPRVGRDSLAADGRRRGTISIHAPRVGRDDGYVALVHESFYFNPRAPCGARRYILEYKSGIEEFQSTRPVWGATSR